MADATKPLARSAIRRVVFLGPPGAGKGTQAARLSAHLSLPKISTGDMLRQAVAQGTFLGKEAAPHMGLGNLVPDHFLIQMIEERIRKEDCAAGFVLDGFPRTLVQAQALERLGPGKDAELVVLKLEVPRDELIRRLSGRRLCPRCQATYHLHSSPPRQDSLCDRDGTALMQREDDKEAAVARRLAEYDAQTRPLIAYYQPRARLHRVDGHQPADAVFEILSQIVAGEK